MFRRLQRVVVATGTSHDRRGKQGNSRVRWKGAHRYSCDRNEFLGSFSLRGKETNASNPKGRGNH